MTVGCAAPQVPTIGSLQQYEVDASTTIPEGASTTERFVVFGALLKSSSSNALKLQVELSASTSFAGALTATSGAVAVNTSTTAQIVNIPLGSYYWRARALDTITGATSSWTQFGATDTIDIVSTSTAGYELSDGSVKALYHLADLKDTSGEGHRLTNNNGVSFAAGKFGNAADQGSSNSTKYLSADTTLGINGGAITLAAWINPNSINTGDNVFVYQGNSSNNVVYILYYDQSAGNLLFLGFIAEIQCSRPKLVNGSENRCSFILDKKYDELRWLRLTRVTAYGMNVFR